MISIIIMFSGKTIDAIVSTVEKALPFIKGRLHEMLAKQQQKLRDREVNDNKSIIAQIWDVVIMAMVGYFIMSLINSSVNEYLVGFYL